MVEELLTKDYVIEDRRKRFLQSLEKLLQIKL